MTTQSIQTIVANFTTNQRGSQHMDYTLPDGTNHWVDGELYYNRELERHEHTHVVVDADDNIINEFLIVSK